MPKIRIAPQIPVVVLDESEMPVVVGLSLRLHDVLPSNAPADVARPDGLRPCRSQATSPTRSSLFA